MTQVLIKAENVSKKFAKDFKQSLWYGVKDVFSKVNRNQKKTSLRKSEFWAVKEVSFEVRKGECLGLIGHNGAGKSTLLKMLNGLIAPDEGSITIYGKVAALIELGAGFNPILTGRENIYNNAAVMGFTKQEVDEKFDSIVAFSEIGDFIDTPVQNYSSGMKVRLGFAIAAQLEPDVLLIDEVLAVGDLGFRIKCINRIQELLRSCAVIFVSHAMTQVTTICTHILFMDHGKTEYSGDNVAFGVQKYLSKFSGIESQILGAKNVLLSKVDISSGNTNHTENGILLINSGAPLKVDLIFNVDSHVKQIHIRIGIFNIEYRLVAEVDSDQTNTKYYNTNNTLQASVLISNLYLRSGKYSLHVHVTDAEKKQKILRQSDIASFIVKNTITVGADFLLPAQWS